MNMKNKPSALEIFVGLTVILIVICAFMIGSPRYYIYSERARGQAELARAEANRSIKILEAIAHRESATALAEAEVLRAEGVAKANKIIGDSLQGNDAYLRYLYITHLSESKDKTVIYIPTEGALPILESQRLRTAP